MSIETTFSFWGGVKNTFSKLMMENRGNVMNLIILPYQKFVWMNATHQALTKIFKNLFILKY